jgi:hypothetical protein
MTGKYSALLGRLEQAGWQVERLAQPRALADDILRRYPRIPPDYRVFVESLGSAVGPGETSWLVTSGEFNGTASTAWAWNAWEQQSLEAAGEDRSLIEEVRAFWDRHLPIVMSTKSCYAYFALDLETRQIVQGEEPLYEDVGDPVASSLEELFRLIADRDERLRLYV